MKKQAAICSFRLDDITADMNWNTFYEVKSVFDKYHIKPLIGVVPDNQDHTLQKGESCGHFWEIIRGLQESGWTIAQHGYRHVYCSHNGGLLGLKSVSEFAGLSYEEQNAKIGAGKEILQKQGIYVTIFMAPGHTFDRNTLRALRKNGFGYITDGYSSRVYQRRGMIHIPCRSAKPQSNKGVDTICLHTNMMKSSDVRQLEHFIAQNRVSVVDYRELMEIKPCKTAFVACMEEKKNLLLWRARKFAASNEAVHEYLVATDDTNPKVKNRRRIAKLPALLVRLLKKQA